MTDTIFTLAIQKSLLAWFSQNKRDLPWRTKTIRLDGLLRDPYYILVSELMLQQTQVSRVLPKFAAFLARWSTWEALARAKQSDVLIAWAGLGYNRRALYLWRTARAVSLQFGGVFPHDPHDIEALPGVGSYTSRALRVFALGEQTYMIDTNIRRIIQRVFFADTVTGEKEIAAMAARILPKGQADTWHQCLMDFGASVCQTVPRCETCPLATLCQANGKSKKQGYDTYSAFLKARGKRQTGKSLPFRLTDRYFRGRIIDFLRRGACPMEELQKYICVTCALGDRVRFGMLIESLMKERMIQIKGSMVMLADEENAFPDTI